MHKTDGTGHVANLFIDGDPGVPTAGTQIEEDWLNAVQTELVNAVEGAGITLVKGTNTQLKEAMGLSAVVPAVGGERKFGAKVTVSVAAGSAIVGTTASGTATDAGVEGNSELSTGVEGNTSDGIAGQFNVAGTGKAIEANGPVDINGAANISGVLSLGTFSTDGSFPAAPAAGDIVYLGGANDKLYCYDGTTWQAFW